VSFKPEGAFFDSEDGTESLSAKINDIKVTQCIQDAVRACNFMVTIANPQAEDCPLIAVSPEFESMTGFHTSEIIGANCRFLNHNCDMDPGDLMQLRRCSETGAPFTAVIPNRKKSGELFLNLLDLRGLTVGRNPDTGQDLWFLIGVQADVTNVSDGEIDRGHWPELQIVANAIRSNIALELSKMALTGAAESMEELPPLVPEDSPKAKSSEWHLLKEPVWSFDATHTKNSSSQASSNGKQHGSDTLTGGHSNSSKAPVEFSSTKDGANPEATKRPSVRFQEQANISSSICLAGGVVLGVAAIAISMRKFKGAGQPW
jgi:hypothetical protein